MIRLIYRQLSPKNKLKVKKYHHKLNKKISDLFFSYDEDALVRALEKLGVVAGDTVLVHSSFKYSNGFKGNPQDIIKCLLQVLGPKGNLLMVSLPYHSSSQEYLMKQPVFDVRKTPSMMGIISEVFRRKNGVLRSLSPTHPVLAFGEKAAWIVEGHERCAYPCGKDSPFDKLRLLNGKILFFDVAFPFTFIHYIEDLIKDMLPFPLYTEEPIPARMFNYKGESITLNTFVYPKWVYSTRKATVLEGRLIKENYLKKLRIGRTRLKLAKAEDAIQCTYKMLEEKIYFYSGVNKDE
jgi:aminoglycoside 3-N-acetyltransferase